MSRSWPLVVYYYGGVSPRDERFTFTYHWWAANGYMVYVLNPSGSVGYGQAFADLHSNDWGTRATRDILDGVDSLLKAKPFIDGARMAAYGGSYGGFITLDLATKTDRFAALCSDAGISNIASYFGGGAWGFTYGDIALPGGFPWNRPDIFAGKSPLFHADKIKTPLLLIHGLDDHQRPRAGIRADVHRAEAAGPRRRLRPLSGRGPFDPAQIFELRDLPRNDAGVVRQIRQARARRLVRPLETRLIRFATRNAQGGPFRPPCFCPLFLL